MKPSQEYSSGRKITLRYGNQAVDICLEGWSRVRVLKPCLSPLRSLRDRLREALSKPIASYPLRDLIRKAQSVLICVPDRTRPPVAKAMLPLLLEELSPFIDSKQVSLFVATGTHARHGAKDFDFVIGEDIVRSFPVYQNLSTSLDEFGSVGTTSRGTPVKINRMILESDLVVMIGSIAFHYFAGMTGGRKMLLPGASHIDTIMHNHKLTLTPDGELNPLCSSGRLTGNPVHEDMVEGIANLGNLFHINVVLDGGSNIADVIAGDSVNSHLEACNLAKNLLSIDVGRCCDIAVAGAGGVPTDTNFIQAHKAIEHAAHCVRDGGVLVCLAECSNGIGSSTFLKWFDLGGSAEVAHKLKRFYEINGHTALSLIKKTERIEIVLVSSLPKETVERMGLIPAATIQDALEIAERRIGTDGLVYVFPSAWGILPVVSNG